MPRGWQWVDPLKDAQSALLEISMGINSPQRVAARLGRPYEEILAELAAHYAALRITGDGPSLPMVLSTLTRDPGKAPPPEVHQHTDPGDPEETGKGTKHDDH